MSHKQKWAFHGKVQPSEVRIEYKYSGWNENPTESVKEAVAAVFDRGETVVDDPILYFYAPKYTESRWHESQDFVIEVGGHRFFKEWDAQGGMSDAS